MPMAAKHVSELDATVGLLADLIIVEFLGAAFTLMKEAQDVTLGSCYDWTMTRRLSQLRVKFKFGVAYAMSKWLAEALHSGVMGFGLRS